MYYCQHYCCFTDAGKQRQIEKSIAEDRNVGAQCKMRKMLLMWTLTGSSEEWSLLGHFISCVIYCICSKSFIQTICCIFKCCFLLKWFSDCFYVLNTVYYVPLIKTSNRSAHLVSNQSHHSPVKILRGIYSKCNQ